MKKAIIIVIAVVVAVAACAVGAAAYHNNKIKEMREAGVRELNSSVSFDDYSKAQQDEIRSIIDAGGRKILEAEEQDQVDEAIEEANALIADVKTLAQMREEGKEELEGLVSLDDYRKKQQKKIKEILSDSEEKIDEADSEADIKTIIKSASAMIDKVKTDAELTKEEEEAAAAEAEAARAAAAAKAAASARSSRK